MAIPNWIVSIESKAIRERALSLWADFQREREKAQLDYQRVVDEAEIRYDNAFKSALDKRHRVTQKARNAYDEAKESLLLELKETAA
ncbi:hypothetical protein LCGC14_2788820 [marine sediment metagenome]|uniref:Uncharacterized protein n=1 Tax=marine sediment metagenome TaxID=412755 RepID=A0A0F9BHK9_9ZZZZ